MKTGKIALALAFAVFSLSADAANSTTNRTSNGGGQRGDSGDRKPPESPIVKALDANGDGVIDAKEIANASAALKKLDKNGDGKLTRDEIMPSHQKGKGGRGGRPGDGNDQGQPPPPPNE